MIISDKKYACETCIKGHRSSSCKHFDRPLFEIKKKGRPITQCEHCRELRKTKQVHVKCICEGKADPAAASAKKGSKLGLESAAFPNGLPVQQAMGTLVALPAPPSGSASPDSLENNDGGCVCASGGSCHCCVPKKTHRRSRTTSGQPSQQSDRVLARIAELRPVLPAPSPEYFLYGSGGHDLTTTTTTTTTGTLHHLNHSNHLHPRHHENVYSPYGRAYDAHHPHPSYDVASVDRGRMSLSPAQETPTTTTTTTFCDCGEGCLCQGCGAAAGGAGAGCTNPEGCNACLGCTLNALQPLFHPSASDQSSQESIDEWLRSLGQQQQLNDGTTTAAVADLGHGLPWDRDMITAGMVSADGSVKTTTTTTTTNATTTTTNTNGGGTTGSDPDYSSIHFPSVEEVVDFGSPSYFRLSRSSSHGSSSAWHPYMDPSFLQSLRFGIEPAPSPVGLHLNHPHLGHQVVAGTGVGGTGEPVRPRSHSPAGTTTTGTGEGTVGLNLGMANLHVSQPVPGFGVGVASNSNHSNSNHGLRQQQMYNVNMAGGMRSAPQLNVNVNLGQGYHCGSYGVGLGGGGGGGGGLSDGSSSDCSIRDNRSTANY